jgi:hypothetical protein
MKGFGILKGRRLLIGCTGLLMFAVAADAEETVFRSADTQTALIELYTSEGCSSCPPAEAWMTKLGDDQRLWKDFVPVAFHVDYWDELGWTDRFASPAYSERQRAYASNWARPTIYTPGFVLNGDEWRSWFSSGPRGERGAKTGVLEVRQTEPQQFEIRFVPTDPESGPYEVYGALLGCGFESDVKAGENEGRKLRHDFTALSLRRLDLRPDGTGAVATMKLERPDNLPAPKLAAAFWVTKAGQLAPVQAAGGFLP